MRLDYAILLRVSLRHGYFPGGRFRGMQARVSESSAGDLQANGLLFKAAEDGFSILYDTHSGGSPRGRNEVLNEPLSLRFTLTLHDQEFFNYTDLKPGNLALSAFYFSNQAAGGEELLQLHPEEHVTIKDARGLNELPGTYFVKPFGLIELTIGPSLRADYEIRFREKSTHWRYVVTGDSLQQLSHPAVVGGNETFTGPEKIILPNRREALVFVSEKPIRLQQFPDTTFQLVENGVNGNGRHKVVIQALPTPDPAHISALPGKTAGAEEYSEIFIQ